MAELRRPRPRGGSRNGHRQHTLTPAPGLPPTTLVLIRHGHTLHNTPGAGARLLGWTDAPLSEAGLDQVQRLCARIQEAPPQALYTSPLCRARETARALGETLGLRPHVRAALREIHCGALDGLPVRQVKHDYPDLWQRNLAQCEDTFRWPGGESYAELRARALRALGRIAAAHRGERVAVVTHTGVITQVLGALHGTPAARWEAFRAGNASLTVLRWTAGSGGRRTGPPCAQVEVFDDRSHLTSDSA